MKTYEEWLRNGPSVTPLGEMLEAVEAKASALRAVAAASASGEISALLGVGEECPTETRLTMFADLAFHGKTRRVRFYCGHGHPGRDADPRLLASWSTNPERRARWERLIEEAPAAFDAAIARLRARVGASDDALDDGLGGHHD